MFAWGVHECAGSCVRRVTIGVGNASQVLQLGVDESYTLTVSASGDVAIEAPAVWGAMHALESLSQLVVWENATAGYELANAPWAIVDAPRFQHRAVMIDSARHFLSVGTMNRQIDAASYGKLNTLHWHATDAESMPLETAAFPSVAAKGAFARKFVYSIAQQTELVQHAAERGVRLMLEVDMPGHNYAYFLGKQSGLMADCPNTLAPVSNEFWKASFDPTNPALYAFLDTFIGELAGRFPEQVLHLGGDEVVYQCWNESVKIRAYMKQHGMTLPQLYTMFERKVHAIAARHGKSVMTWDEVFSAAQSVLPKDAIVCVYRGVATLAAAVKAGFRAVQTAGFYLNTGFDYSTGGEIQWYDVYSHDPMPENLTAAEQGRVLGAEACMWSEDVDDFNIDQRLWLRASVFAERVWSTNATLAARVHPWPPTRENSNSVTGPADIVVRMMRHRCRLLQRGIRPEPFNTRDVFPRRNRWAQCETFLPSVHSMKVT